jgi:hypothetical protein
MLPQKRLLDQARDRLRLKNYAYWTEKGCLGERNYCSWLRWKLQAAMPKNRIA